MLKTDDDTQSSNHLQRQRKKNNLHDFLKSLERTNQNFRKDKNVRDFRLKDRPKVILCEIKTNRSRGRSIQSSLRGFLGRHDVVFLNWKNKINLGIGGKVLSRVLSDFNSSLLPEYQRKCFSTFRYELRA